MGIVGVIFWDIILRLCGYLCLKATSEYSKNYDGTAGVILFGLLTLLFCGIIFFFNPYAVLVFYQTMILPLSPTFPQIGYWQMFWITFVWGFVNFRFSANVNMKG